LIHWLDTLDNIDNCILDLLGKDGRMSASQISKVKGIEMTERGINKRLKRLQQERIVLGYTTVLNPDILSKKICMVLTLKFRNSSKTTELINRLNTYVRKSFCCLSAARTLRGDFDYICEFVFESQKQYKIEIKNFLYIFKDLISEYHVYESNIIKCRGYRASYSPTLEESKQRIIRNLLFPTKDEQKKEIFQVVVESLAEDFGIQFTGIWLLDKKTNDLVLKFNSGTLGMREEPLKLATENTKIREILSEKIPVNVYDVINDHRIREIFPNWENKEKDIRSLAIYPLTESNQVIGMLMMINDRRLSLAKFDLLENFLEQALKDAIITN
jgi:DNA-binding Lrp family transcriptional regulator